MPDEEPPGTDPRAWFGWVNDQWRSMTRSALDMTPPFTAAPFEMTGASMMSALKTMPDASFGAPQLMLERVLAQLQSRLVGRPLRLRVGSSPVELSLADIRFQPSTAALAVGQIGDVDVDARDLQWAKGRIDELAVHFGNVHVRPGRQSTLIVAPVLVHAVLGQESLDAWLRRAAPALDVELLEDGRAFVAPSRGRRWGRAEVVPRVEGSQIRFTAIAVELRGRRVGLPRPVPAPVSVAVPALPWGLRAREVEVTNGRLRITASIDEWRHRLVPRRLQHLDKLLRGGAADLDLSDWAEPAPPDIEPSAEEDR